MLTVHPLVGIEILHAVASMSQFNDLAHLCQSEFKRCPVHRRGQLTEFIRKDINFLEEKREIETFMFHVFRHAIHASDSCQHRFTRFVAKLGGVSFDVLNIQ